MTERRTFHVEVLFAPATNPSTSQTRLVVTCLRCGAVAKHPLYAAYAAAVTPFVHRCDDIDRDLAALAEFSWKSVVRDAFLEGRDDEAIKLICEEMGLISI